MSEGRKFDLGKPRMGLLPPHATIEVAEVLTYGAKKYDPENWRKVDNARARYIDASLRHIFDYLKGEECDTESARHHLAHAMCCLAFVTELDILERRRLPCPETRPMDQSHSLGLRPLSASGPSSSPSEDGKAQSEHQTPSPTGSSGESR